MMILYVILGLLAIGLIIFIHEAGHFLAAKKVGVRVDRFALGFDPPIAGYHLRFFSKRWGETEYVVGMIPFGGYVKLAGEVPEEGAELAEDELMAKSVGARALVFVAGAVMNFLSAFVFFMIAFSFGVGFPEPRIGYLAPGSPAWEAGLAPGDEILAIDGNKVRDFHEIYLAVAFEGPDETLRLEVRRPPRAPGEEARTFTTDVKTEWNEELGMSMIGVERALQGPVMAEDPPAGSAAARAGLQKGDGISGLEAWGQVLPRVPDQVLLGQLRTQLSLFPDRPVRIRVRRASGAEDWVELAMEPAGAPPEPALRVARGGGTIVEDIAPGSSAASFLTRGERLVALSGRPLPSPDLSVVGPLLGDAGDARLTLLSGGGEERTVSVPRQEFLRWILQNEILWTDHSLRLPSIDAASPLAKEGLETYDIVARLAGRPVYSADDLKAALKEAAAPEVDLVVLRRGERVSLRLSRTAALALTDVRWRTFAPLAAVAPSGPAGKAGVTPGSRLLRLGETEVGSFEDLVDAVKLLEVGRPATVEWIDAQGARHEAALQPGATRYEPPGLALNTPEILVEAGILESFVLGVERTVLVGKQIFLTLRSLIRQDVSPKNLAGPIGITHLFTKVAELGVIDLLFWMAIVSVNLGILNLLPFPILDGGHLLFLAIEKIKGSPVNLQVQEWATRVAFLLIITLALFVTYHDFARLLFR